MLNLTLEEVSLFTRDVEKDNFLFMKRAENNLENKHLNPYLKKSTDTDIFKVSKSMRSKGFDNKM